MNKVEAAFSAKQQAMLDELAHTDAHNVMQVAINQLKMLADYYDLSLRHANRSFRVAIVAAVIGLVFFLGIAAQFVLGWASTESVTFGVVGGAIAEFIAGVNFLLYGKTLEQLNLFQGKLEGTQRFLLAHSLSASIADPQLQDQTRIHLIGALVGASSEYLVRDAFGRTNAAGAGADASSGMQPTEPLPPS